MLMLRPTAKRLARRVGNFTRDESGYMSFQILFFLFIMLLVGGIAVDVMRFETKRVTLQQTMDRALLAAASLGNKLTPRDVVDSYLATSGVDATLKDFKVVTTLNGRTVQARATTHSDNYFMSMMDVPYLESDSRSMAAQTISNVEISMVLDVSGSMQNTPSRIANLKIAAKKFVDDVLLKDAYNKISISIIPYNGQVNVGPTLFSKFNVTDVSGIPNSYCLDLPTSTYSSTALSRGTPFPQTPFVDSWTSTSQTDGSVALQGPTVSNGRYSNMWCQPTPENYVSVHSNNAGDLKAQIQGLVAVGATSIDLGLKWGTALLDPEAHSIVAEMASSGDVPSYFSSRPGAYNDPEVLKVVILMTDGENFVQERHGDDYRVGPSPIWQSNSGSKEMSIFHESKVDNGSSSKICASRPFYVPHLSAWHSRPWNGSTPSSSTCYSKTASYSGATPQTWQNVWSKARTNWVAWQLYARPLGGSGSGNSSKRNTIFDEWVETFRTYTDVNTMNSRLDQLCEVAKGKGILIFGIAFEAPPGGQSAIQDCASQPSNKFFFNAQGSTIGTAFEMIAASLSQLRLTQ